MLRSIIEWLPRFVAWLMNRVRVNRVRPEVRDGVPVYVKSRRAGGSMIIWFANRFLALARSGIRMFVRADEWVDWEIQCAGLLYPERRRVTTGPGQCVITPQVRGVSLRELLHCHGTDVRPFVAAARELRRVHQIPCSYFQAAWSHGDLHLDNIVYDQEADQAVLIDFDTRHECRVSVEQRHSDDLKVMLLELLGRPDEQWRPLAEAVIEEYGDSSVLHALRRQLYVPHGFAKILWFTRTSCSSTRQIDQRLSCLRRMIDQVVAPTNTSTKTQVGCDTSQGERNCLRNG